MRSKARMNPLAVWVLIALIAWLASARAMAAPPPADKAGARTVALERSVPRAVRFGRRAAQVGDEADQTISLEMRLTTSLRHNNELVQKDKTIVHTKQQRTVEATDVVGGRTIEARVHWQQATRQILADEAQESGEAVLQPVHGKSYVCRRDGDEQAKLIVTDAEGSVPPWKEYEFVSQSMEMIGRANPLLQYLSGRTVAVGETLELPEQVAIRLFNLGERFGQVTRFDLKLENIEQRHGSECAVFLASVEAASNDSSQMRMQVEGPLVIEVQSCRAAELALAGPIAMSETRGSYSRATQVIGTGQMNLRIASVYRDARR